MEAWQGRCDNFDFDDGAAVTPLFSLGLLSPLPPPLLLSCHSIAHHHSHRFMQTGAILSAFTSKFSRALETGDANRILAGSVQSPIPIYPTKEIEHDGNLSPSDRRDVEQRATAAILADEAYEDEDVFDDDSINIPQSMSASFCPPQASVSPAAMFLSAFSSPSPTPPPDAEGNIVGGYTLGSIVGYGAFSTIRRAYSKSGDVVAVKIVRRSDLFKQGNTALARKRVKREAAVWATFSHEHILPLFSAVHTTYADYFFTLFCPAGSLFDILKRDGRPALPQDDAGMMFRQVVRGLRYLHEVVHYVHRDIKLENVLVDEMGVCRIGDFGMTRKIGELAEEDLELPEENVEPVQQAGHATVHRAVSLILPSPRRTLKSSLQAQLARHRSSTSALNSARPQVFQPGSLPYAAPELLLPQTSGPLLPNPAQDIWALGVLLYGLLTGHLPFHDPFEPRLQMKIINGTYDVPHGIGRGAERVLQGCLEPSVGSRWTIAMVDEVAWGIGWGTEGDDVTPADSDEEFQIVKSPSCSGSRCTPDVPIPESPGWQHEEQRSRPSLDAASRRSSSRMQRSLSRAPIPTSRSSSMRPMLGRSVSRHSRASSPSSTSYNTSILSPTSNGPRSASSSRGPYTDSSLPPSASRERGRRRNKLHNHSSSRSPSPSLAPSTPTDLGSSRFSASREVVDDEIERSSSRGRKKYTRAMRPLRMDHLCDGASELDVVTEAVDWAAPSTTSTTSPTYSALPDSLHPRRPTTRSRSNHSEYHPLFSSTPSSSENNKKRSGSSPPTRIVLWPSLSGGGGSSVRRFAMPTQGLITPVASTTSVKRLTRSRSLEYLHS
ncbi:Serine/threonine protein kinase OSK4 [Hypsizygus marmoreus]|uniref:Serine/threonine protein kinase OSK4 n=1 Tax=Hypsizygus marmoreus TaxID=39966 RepID=A0A369IYA5_HYPMA|nr:Serine/threonine protein kinase OSK4 [Hypsizygus marmoreus]